MSTFEGLCSAGTEASTVPQSPSDDIVFLLEESSLLVQHNELEHLRVERYHEGVFKRWVFALADYGSFNFHSFRVSHQNVWSLRCRICSYHRAQKLSATQKLGVLDSYVNAH